MGVKEVLSGLVNIGRGGKYIGVYDPAGQTKRKEAVYRPKDGKWLELSKLNTSVSDSVVVLVANPRGVDYVPEYPVDVDPNAVIDDIISAMSITDDVPIVSYMPKDRLNTYAFWLLGKMLADAIDAYKEKFMARNIRMYNLQHILAHAAQEYLQKDLKSVVCGLYVPVLKTVYIVVFKEDGGVSHIRATERSDVEKVKEWITTSWAGYEQCVFGVNVDVNYLYEYIWKNKDSFNNLASEYLSLQERYSGIFLAVSFLVLVASSILLANQAIRVSVTKAKLEAELAKYKAKVVDMEDKRKSLLYRQGKLGALVKEKSSLGKVGPLGNWLDSFLAIAHPKRLTFGFDNNKWWVKASYSDPAKAAHDWLLVKKSGIPARFLIVGRTYVIASPGANLTRRKTLFGGLHF